MKTHSLNAGFSLVEFVMVLAIIGIVTAFGSTLLSAGFTAYTTSRNITDAQWQGVIAFSRMTRDLEAIRSPQDITSMAATSLTFNDFQGDSNTYQFSGATITLNGQILADGVNSVNFAYYDKNGIATSITTNVKYIALAINITKGNTNYNLNTTVYPRNL